MPSIDIMIAKNWLCFIIVDPHIHLVIYAYGVMLKGIVCCREERCRFVTFARIIYAIHVTAMMNKKARLGWQSYRKCARQYVNRDITSLLRHVPVT